MVFKRALAIALCLLVTPVLGNQVIVHSYTASGSIDATIDGQRMTVPDDMANRHRQMISAWEDRGNHIPEYHAPAASTDPNDYPLERWRFMAMLEIAGLTPTVDDAIAGIPDETQRAVARARFDNEPTFNRSDSLLNGLAAAAGLTSKQIDAYWMQAVNLPAD